MSTPDLAAQFRGHFGHRDHLYGVLLAELADDLDAGGPTVLICRDHLEAPRGDAVQLRLLAGIFRIVLRGDAPQLERYYPCLGGTTDPGRAWPELRPVLEEHVQELRAALTTAPQTNEVGRSACLAVGLVDAVRRHGLHRVRLLEPGASAGLNLNVDRYRITGQDWGWGPQRSPVHLETGCAGVRPQPTESMETVEIVERRGCDLAPVDVSTCEGARHLTSFVWPFDLDRHARLAAALQIAREHPPQVDRAPASTWLTGQLAHTPDEGVLTVVWTSITRQYWPEQETAAVERAIASARRRFPVAHVSMEGVPPPQTARGYDLAEHGPLTTVDGHPVARSHHHGPPLLLVSGPEPA